MERRVSTALLDAVLDKAAVTRRVVCLDCGDVLLSLEWPAQEVERHRQALKAARPRRPCRGCGGTGTREVVDPGGRWMTVPCRCRLVSR